jgi:hypothetical protein
MPRRAFHVEVEDILLSQVKKLGQSVVQKEHEIMDYPIEGSCQCGQVTYKLHKAPQRVQACHCTECQKLATSPFSVTAIVASEAIEFEGELREWSRFADSGNRSIAKFCPHCGNRVYHYNPEDSATIKLKLKPVNMSDDSIFKPTIHIWASEKQSWYQIPEGVEVFDKQP